MGDTVKKRTSVALDGVLQRRLAILVAYKGRSQFEELNQVVREHLDREEPLHIPMERRA